MNITELTQQLDQDAQLELFELDLSVITGTNTPADHFYFINETDSNGQPIVWQGRTYQPYPIQATGFEMSTKGTIPSPTLTMGNVTGILTPLLKQYDDFLGVMVIRRRTYARYLDGQPGADPNQHLEDDVYFVERRISSDRISVVWELASAMDLQGFELPARTVIKDYCSAEYRSAECSYNAEVYFDVTNKPVADRAQDVCSKTPGGCKVRFGEKAVLPFGGFPGARAYKL